MTSIESKIDGFADLQRTVQVIAQNLGVRVPPQDGSPGAQGDQTKVKRTLSNPALRRGASDKARFM